MKEKGRESEGESEKRESERKEVANWPFRGIGPAAAVHAP